jgi:thiamine biosynthesis protein ThiI
MLLLSGGIDSPVAGHLLQKRGLELKACYFHSFPYTGDGAKDKVVRLAKVLAERQTDTELFVIPFTKIQESLRDFTEPKFLVLLYRRAMIRIAEAIAKERNIRAIVTGESLGQVASQTLFNLAAIGDVATLPILRPLIGFDKAEIIVLARKLGTYDISIEPHDDCCSLFVPKHPETKAIIKYVRIEENKIDLDPLIREALESKEIINI